MLKLRINKAKVIMKQAEDIFAGKTNRTEDSVDQISKLADEMRALFAEALLSGGSVRETGLYVDAANKLQARCVRSGVRPWVKDAA